MRRSRKGGFVSGKRYHCACDTFDKVDGVQCIGGTGAVALVAHFLGSNHPCKDVYVSNPTWGNHHSIFKRAGMNVKTYRYYKESARSLDFEGFIEDLKVRMDMG